MNLKTKLIITFSVVIAVPLFFDYDCIYRIYEYAARRGGYASDEGVPGGDASFGAFDYGNDQRVSDRLDIPQHFKSYRDHEESHPEYS